ncbi:choline dehydrogenase [Rhodospira trueperi]|uniref:Choline dehydrogenase n=1 Tax=Rhodospira trueperi TaxID=69960 RepID=A0A1G7FYY8_9PROT|nr:choline dehydrogenase [Rhodospira trueperi]SDE81111.1 choline dehydrogenase [Rhodospira trueperi]
MSHPIGSYDYIIIGAGTAGCVLANRLSEDPGVKVLLIEAGGRDWSPYLHMPAGFARPLKSKRLNWGHQSDPEPFADNRVINQPRGRVWGGSSSINRMVYTRGHALDYERWAEETGDPSWGYAHCLPYFRKAEDFPEIGDSPFHGRGGPLKVTRGNRWTPVYDAFIEAGQQAGYPRTDDLNGEHQEGFGPLDMTVGQGRRSSTATAYLHPILRRVNLTFLSRSQVCAILVNSKGRTQGIDAMTPKGERKLRVTREVILAAGAINSPLLLMLSGIGDPEILEDLNIPVISPLPGVGANLQDHPEVYIQYKCKTPQTLYGTQSGLRQASIAREWWSRGTGLGATNHFEAGGFIRSESGVRHPNLKVHVRPTAAAYDGSDLKPMHAYQAHVGPVRPESRGRVVPYSDNPMERARIQFNYLSTETDRREMRDAVKLTREIMTQPALTPFNDGELAPGPDVTSDADLDAWIRQTVQSAHHPAGTCAMGPESDPMAVVDTWGRVRGVEGLRVIDASIMPSIVSGDLTAPTIMLAEKIADGIRGRDPEPPETVPVHIAEDWETKQR